MPAANLQLPATLIFEVVVSIGVAAWAWSLANASRQPPLRWALGTMLGAFAIHRACAWLVAATQDPDAAFSSTGQVWGLLGPFLGTIVVFVGTPIVVGFTMPTVPRRRG